MPRASSIWPACGKWRRDWPGLVGMDLAKDVSLTQRMQWDETTVGLEDGLYGAPKAARYKVVAVDYGLKRNILRCLTSAGCDVTVVPATTASAEDILAMQARRRVPVERPGRSGGDRRICGAGNPEARRFGQARLRHLPRPPDAGAGARAPRPSKMHQGHHGANHPVKDFTTGKVEITSMNHGFTVDRDSLPEGVVETHVSLFDGSNCRHRARRQAGVLGAVSPGSLARPPGQPLSLRALRRRDGEGEGLRGERAGRHRLSRRLR